jgi:hypothetical protein
MMPFDMAFMTPFEDGRNSNFRALSLTIVLGLPRLAKYPPRQKVCPKLQVSAPSGPRNQQSLPFTQSPLRGLFAFCPAVATGAAHQFLRNCPLVEKLWLLRVQCVREDRRNVEPQHNHQFRTIGHEINPAYQRALSPNLGPREVGVSRLRSR